MGFIFGNSSRNRYHGKNQRSSWQRRGRQIRDYECELRDSPNSNKFRYVVKWNIQGRKYYIGDCEPSYSDNKVNEDHIRELIEEMEKSDCYRADICDWTMYVYSILLAIVVVILVIVGSSIKKVSNTGSLVCTLIGFTIMIIGIIGLVCLCKVRRWRQYMRADEMKSIASRVSRRVFYPLGARLEVSPLSSYISIWFDFKSEPQAQPQSQPQLQLQPHVQIVSQPQPMAYQQPMMYQQPMVYQQPMMPQMQTNNMYYGAHPQQPLQMQYAQPIYGQPTPGY